LKLLRHVLSGKDMCMNIAEQPRIRAPTFGVTHRNRAQYLALSPACLHVDVAQAAGAAISHAV
jgi:hypothetical protein